MIPRPALRRAVRISITMATFNGAAYLREQLQSFVDQTRRPDELVVSDDGSTDATREILEAFRGHAPFDVILRFNARNLGYAGNFDRALDMATGDLVFLSDQDDVWLPEKIDVMTTIAETTDALVLMNDALISDEGLAESGSTALGQIRAAGLPDSDFVMGCCAAVRADLLQLILPVDGGYAAHDSWIVRIAEGMGRKHIHEQALQYYRRHGANASDLFVSRTKPVTRLSRFVDEFTRIRRSGTHEELEQLLRHQQALLRGVRRALMRAGGREAEDLERYQRSLETRVAHIEERIAMRTMSRVYRLPKIVRLAARDGYAHARGFKSIARDMFLK